MDPSIKTSEQSLLDLTFPGYVALSLKPVELLPICPGRRMLLSPLLIHVFRITECFPINQRSSGIMLFRNMLLLIQMHAHYGFAQGQVYLK